MSGDATTTPLLATASDSPEHNEQSISSRRWAHSVAAFHQDFRLLLTSRTKHFIIMTTVALDVAILLANIFIQLIACQMHQDDELWVKKLVSGIEAVGLLFSCIFMVELIASLFSFGLRYLTSWFHFFDATVIVFSFLIDVTTTGLTNSIGSLIVVLRLWRLAKISEEVILGATERMELLEQHLNELEHENLQLRTQLGIDTQEDVTN